jgi:hypothetical protein
MSGIINKFTRLSTALDILKNQRIILSNPFKWEDKNDTNCLKKYKDKIGLKTVLASCFVDGRERYHHWKIYANGSAKNIGVCIEFDKEKFIQAVTSAKELLIKKDPKKYIELGNIKYRWVHKFKEEVNNNLATIVMKLPFRKRGTYGPDNEFRIIYGDFEEKLRFYSITIPRGIIRKITLSPKAKKEDEMKLVNIKNDLPDCHSLLINYSGMLDHEKWKKVLDSI